MLASLGISRDRFGEQNSKSVHQRRAVVGNYLQCVFPCSALQAEGLEEEEGSVLGLFIEENVWEHRADLSLHLLLRSLSFLMSPNERKTSGFLTKGDGQCPPCKDKSPFHPEPHPCTLGVTA